MYQKKQIKLQDNVSQIGHMSVEKCEDSSEASKACEQKMFRPIIPRIVKGEEKKNNYNHETSDNLSKNPKHQSNETKQQKPQSEKTIKQEYEENQQSELTFPIKQQVVKQQITPNFCVKQQNPTEQLQRQAAKGQPKSELVQSYYKQYVKLYRESDILNKQLNYVRSERDKLYKHLYELKQEQYHRQHTGNQSQQYSDYSRQNNGVNTISHGLNDIFNTAQMPSVSQNIQQLSHSGKNPTHKSQQGRYSVGSPVLQPVHSLNGFIHNDSLGLTLPTAVINNQTAEHLFNGLQEKKTKRVRRSADQISRAFKCPVGQCNRSYGSDGSLLQHIKLKHREWMLSEEHNEWARNR